MFARNRFQHTKSQGVLSADNPVPPEALPNIHEEPTQDIQGGAAGEHYHVTAAEGEYLTQQYNDPDIFEPIIVVGEIILDGNGDIVMGRG